MLSARAAIRALPTYHPPLAGRDGLRLDFNENTVGCSPRVLECLRSINPEQLARYPEREPAERAVAEFLGVTPEETLLTNGVDEGVHLLCQTYLEPDDEVLIVVPTYAMYKIYAVATGARVIEIPAGECFQFPTEDVLSRITPRTRLIAVANPNNPTGALVPPEDLLRIARSAPQAALLVDEAYFEFCGQTILPFRGEIPNLFVARTFSKVYGLAGLRIGVLIGGAQQMQFVRLAGSPYSVNAIALACLPDAIADQDYILRYVSEVCAARELLQDTLQSLAVPHWPSHANFVLARFNMPDLPLSLRRRGILVRDRSADYGCHGCIRMTLGPRAYTEKLLAALRETLPQPAVAPAQPQGAAR
ncbi:MAG TPA: histidinol-phosphate transaminase [Terriglobales bacterium]|jgi:histidinol-phosphate aminotransferase|nr:histidinol-phosphate transaminase [Terriglobales bacterium]